MIFFRAGTLAADDAQVDWEAFEASMGEEDNEHVVASCHEIPTNAVLLMKGDARSQIKLLIPTPSPRQRLICT